MYAVISIVNGKLDEVKLCSSFLGVISEAVEIVKQWSVGVLLNMDSVKTTLTNTRSYQVSDVNNQFSVFIR